MSLLFAFFVFQGFFCQIFVKNYVFSVPFVLF